MALERAFSDLVPAGRRARPRDQRITVREGVLGTATLACPTCDAPVSPGPGPRSPADPLGCPVCGHQAAVRDFLSFAAPVRPARVEVRVVPPRG